MTATEDGVGLATPPAEPDALLNWYADARANHPVARDKQSGVWHVFRYADVSTVLADPASYSSDLTGLFPSQEDFDLFQRGNFVRMDPPQHRKLRVLVSKAFTPRLVAGLEPRIAQVTNALLDEVDGAEPWDLVDRLAYPLPVTVIAELLGVPAADQPTFRRWADAMFEDIDPTVLPDAELMESRAQPLREMNGYLLEHIRARRAAPRDDLISHLTVAEADGQRLTDEEMVGFVGLLLLAGHITTTLLLSNAVSCLDEFPEAAAAVRADRGLIPAAVEEVLRLRTPFSRLVRRTTREVALGGQAIPADRVMMLWVTSANRDAQHFPEPDRFDLHRQPNAHVTFGHGIHFCLGAPLARLEAKVALGIMLDRFAELSVVDGAEWHDPRVIVGAKRLPLLTRAA
jgi:cytochrome P450